MVVNEDNQSESDYHYPTTVDINQTGTFSITNIKESPIKHFQNQNERDMMLEQSPSCMNIQA
jgi:hypothetical protein